MVEAPKVKTGIRIFIHPDAANSIIGMHGWPLGIDAALGSILEIYWSNMVVNLGYYSKQKTVIF
jgi:hypothetical protein